MRRRRGHCDAETLEPVRAPHRDDLSLVRAGDAEASQFASVFDVQAIFFRYCARGGTAERMVACGAETCAEALEHGGIDTLGWLDARQVQIARGHGAGLVEDHRGNIGEILQKARALDQDAVARGHGDSGDGGRRRRHRQGARTGCDQHGKHRRRASGKDKCATGHQQHQRHVLAGVFVEQPGEGRLGILGITHHGNNPSDGAFFTGAG